MRGLFLGDISGRAGRNIIEKELPQLRQKKKLDVVIANADNAAHGFGLSEKVVHQLFKMGIDVLTGGDHLWDQKGIVDLLQKENRIIRFINDDERKVGSFSYLFQTKRDKKILVSHVQTQLFMKRKVSSPFTALEGLLKKYRLSKDLDAIFIDIHGEASSEKMALAHYFDGRVSVMVGSHTHIPTADAHILPKGTGYQTDAGMCGDYDSIIGMTKKTAISRLLSGKDEPHLQPAEGEGRLCGTFFETDDKSGKCVKIEPVIIQPFERSGT